MLLMEREDERYEKRYKFCVRGGLKPSRSKAFTLAEVLITLGIISVVAALTLPTLISNYKKQTYVTGLQKAYSILNNMTKTAMSSDDVTNFSDTQLMQLWSKAIEVHDDYKSVSPEIDNEIKKLFPSAEKVKYPRGVSSLAYYYTYIHTNGKSSSLLPSLDNTHMWPIYTAFDAYCFNTQDSMLYCLYYAPKSYYPNSDFASPDSNDTMNVFVDINGLKKPNELGRDMFVFAIGYRTGIVVPSGGQAIYKDYAENSACGGVPAPYKGSCVNSVMSSYETNKTNPSYYYCFNKKDSKDNVYCADKIITEGWKMNY